MVLEGRRQESPLRRRSDRGSLVATVFIIAVVIVVAFSLTVISLHHWTFSQYVHRRYVAVNLAENAASLAVARLIADSGYGIVSASPTPSPSPGVTITLTDPDYPGGTGRVTFAPEKASELGIPCSLNNQSDVSVDGVQTRVPRQTAQILAHGEYAGARCDVEVMLYVPPYPIALVATGPIVSTGPLVLTGVRSARDYTGDATAVDKLARASMASNFGGEAAINLGPGAVINGNVQAVGKIRMAPTNVVRGAVRPEAAPAPLPPLDMDRYLRQCYSGGGWYWSMPLPAVSMTDLTVEWMKRCEGSLNVNGDVSMEGGTLVVRGDLHVTGAVKGSGAIVCGGGVTVDRGTDLEADTAVAILARGPVVLTGEDETRNCLQGLVYSETSVSATRLTILGAIVTRGTAGPGGVALQNVKVVGAPIPVRLRVGLPASTNADDDQSIFSATCYPDPADPTGRALRWNVNLIAYSDEAEPYARFQGSGTNLTRHQAEELLLELDLRAPHPSANGHNISNATDDSSGRPCVELLRDYLDRLERGLTEATDVINLDLNKLLKPATAPRVLIWRRL